MANSGKEVLDKDSKMPDFCAYIDILLKYLPIPHVDDSSLTAELKGRTGADFSTAYHKQDSINLYGIRRDATNLGSAATAGQAQQDLILENKHLREMIGGQSSEQAWINYQQNQPRLNEDLVKLRESATAVNQVATDMESALETKRSECNFAIDQWINQNLRNNPSDFDLRLKTGKEAIQNQNAGGWMGGSDNKWPYAHHGAPGDYWNWNDVAKNLFQEVVNTAVFAVRKIDKANDAARADIGNQCEILSTSMNTNAPGGPADDGEPVVRPA